MELHPLVSQEWREGHHLSRQSLALIHEHADPGDPHPIITALELLRAEQAQYVLQAPQPCTFFT